MGSEMCIRDRSKILERLWQRRSDYERGRHELAKHSKYKQKPNAWLANGLAAIALIIMLSSIGFKDTVVLFVAMLLLSCVFKLLQAKTKQQRQHFA